MSKAKPVFLVFLVPDVPNACFLDFDEGQTSLNDGDLLVAFPPSWHDETREDYDWKMLRCLAEFRGEASFLGPSPGGGVTGRIKDDDHLYWLYAIKGTQ